MGKVEKVYNKKIDVLIIGEINHNIKNKKGCKMLYRVTYKENTWHVGGAKCTETEAKEFIARRFMPMNENRAIIYMNAIMKENKSKNGHKKN